MLATAVATVAHARLSKTFDTPIVALADGTIVVAANRRGTSWKQVADCSTIGAVVDIAKGNNDFFIAVANRVYRVTDANMNSTLYVLLMLPECALRDSLRGLPGILRESVTS